MGEATYYSKMYFKNQKEAEEALPKIKNFFIEGSRAADFWQDKRGLKEREVFWKDFDARFPTVSEYLKESNLFGKDHNNGLAGNLDFGSIEEIEQMDAIGGYIQYNAYVWHFANWNPIMSFVKEHYGAKECKWISDEYANISDLI